MKRTLLLSVVLCLSLLLTGCSAGSVNTASAVVGVASEQGVTGAADSGQYLLALQLAVGALKLDETEYPVSAEQAASLLPLWKAARSLGKNDTASAQEMSALVDQIRGSMTSEQWKAIQSLGSSTQDLQTIAQELGLQIDPTGQSSDLASASGATTSQSGQAPDAGGMPVDAGAPMDGGAPPDAGAPASSGTSSQVSLGQNSGNGVFMGLSETLLDTVIEFLEAKV
jgi:hypothetical protein